MTDSGTGLRARHRAERLDDIVATALEMVRAEGLEALTTHRLAEKLGLAVGALYRYFPSKTALVVELERRSLAALHAYLDEALGRADGAFRGPNASLARLVLAARAYGRFTQERAAEFALVGQIVADPRNLVTGDAATALTRTTMNLLGFVSELFLHATTEGTLPEGVALERALLFWSALRSVFELRKLRAHVPGFDVDALADAMTRTLLKGFGADDDATARAFTAARRYDTREDDR